MPPPSLAAHPGHQGWPILVIVAPPGLALVAAPAWLATQRFRPACLGLSLVAGFALKDVFGVTL